MKPGYYPERRLILKYLRGKILDIGCNQGIFHKYVLEKGDVVGIDIEISVYKENMIKGNAQCLPFKDNSFDSIFAGEIIEHLINPSQFLREIERMLKDGGYAILTTPNIHSLPYIRLNLFGIPGAPTNSDHIFAWDLYLFQRLIKKTTNMKIIESGFTDSEVIRLSGKLGKLIHRIKPNLSWFIYIILMK